VLDLLRVFRLEQSSLASAFLFLDYMTLCHFSESRLNRPLPTATPFRDPN
jgi:hypothetical protein